MRLRPPSIAKPEQEWPWNAQAIPLRFRRNPSPAVMSADPDAALRARGRTSDHLAVAIHVRSRWSVWRMTGHSTVQA